MTKVISIDVLDIFCSFVYYVFYRSGTKQYLGQTSSP